MRTRFLLTVPFSLAIAACGGGGGGSTPPPSQSFSATTSGVAAKGIIKFATVTAYELNVVGDNIRTVGTSETNASGGYSLTIGSSYAGGPLKLVLSAKSDGSTKMVCDVAAGCGTGVAFGQDYTLPLTFTLAAYQQAVSNGASVKTQITPYTNMAAARIQAQVQTGSPLDNTLVANAISEVNQMVGVDIANTEPVDITNPVAVAAAGATALQYAAFNAGIGNVAFANTAGFEAGIGKVAAAFADGQFDANDDVSIAQIVAAVNTEASATATLGSATLTATLASITSSTTGGTYNPEPAPAATLTAVAQAKGLVGQTRTWGTQIAALQDPADAFGLDIDTASAVLDSNNSALAGVFGQTLVQALNLVTSEAASPSGLLAQDYTYPITHWTETGQITEYGTVTVADNNGSLRLTISAPSIAGVACNGVVTSDIPSSILGTPSANLDLAALNLTVSGSASMSTPSAASITLTNAAFSIALKSGKTSATATEADIASIGFDGALTLAANGVTFTGTGVIKAVANNVANPVAPLSLSEFSVSGTFTGSKGSVNASASVKFNNAATFDTIGLLSHQPVVWVSQGQPDDTFGLATTFATETGGDTLQWASYDSFNNQICTGGLINPDTCQSGDYGIVALIQSAYPTAASVQNIYVNYNAAYGTSYDAVLTYPDFESAGNFANATVTLSSNVALTGYPAATLTVTANRTAYGSSTSPIVGDVVAILSYNGQSLKFEATNTATPATGALTITNPDGVKLVVNGTSDNTTGTVSVDGTQVGTIDDSIGGIPMIHYKDGSFESLN